MEVTARAAADYTRIRPDSALLFYRKIRQAIAYRSELRADEIFDGPVELDKAVLAGSAKAKRGRGTAPVT
ncbi:hypothetical protein C7N83_04615 [Neisseria iguanae]|uniref:Uncharacterized protein n=1 Tax=Neisseria iguanae TaxID=90242 RepID=A0A2P7U1E1_9NEIS|nr:hypothetical protein C7N83_04615 [Neisseria iguanae]